MPLNVVRNDITKMNTEAIVNTANRYPEVGSGCDMAVYTAAGYDELLEQRKAYGIVPEGEVFITDAFALPAKYIIHAVSPLYIDGESGEEEKLRACYRKSLELAASRNIESIAFPLISTGSFGYPKIEGLRIASEEINNFLLNNDMDVTLVVFDENSTGIAERLYPEVKAFISRKYVKEQAEVEYGFSEPDYARTLYAPTNVNESGRMGVPLAAAAAQERLPESDQRASGASVERMPKAAVERKSRTRDLLSGVLPKFGTKGAKGSDISSYDSASRDEISEFYSEPFLRAQKCEASPMLKMDEEYSWADDYEDEIDDSALVERIKHIKDPFGVYFFYLVEKKGMTSQDVQNGAWITKQVYHKIKKNPEEYHPDKTTAFRLSVALKLNLDETKDFLNRAGYAFSPAMEKDLIWEFGIDNGLDIYDISDLMEKFGYPKLVDV